MPYRLAKQLATYWNRCPPRDEWWAQPFSDEPKRVSTREEILAHFALTRGIKV